jgi:hypothetical protein
MTSVTLVLSPWVFRQLSGWRERIRAANSLLNAEARKGNARCAEETDHNNDRTNQPRNTTSKSNGLRSGMPSRFSALRRCFGDQDVLTFVRMTNPPLKILKTQESYGIGSFPHVTVTVTVVEEPPFSVYVNVSSVVPGGLQKFGFGW